MSKTEDNVDNVGADASVDNDTIASGLFVAPQDLMFSTTVTDFARKLYSMLEDASIQSIVSWGPLRDCFVVKDTNEFSKSVLPRIFNHSNFASFVRQLNKYDFHKVKQTAFNQLGDSSCTFRHRDFHGDRPDDLQKIKRKMTITKPLDGTSSGSLPYEPSKSNSGADSPGSSSLPYGSSISNSNSNSLPYHLSSGSNQSQSRSNDDASSSISREGMKVEIERMKDENDDLRVRIRNLEKNYETMQSELHGMERALVQHDGHMQGLMNLVESVNGVSNSKRMSL